MRDSACREGIAFPFKKFHMINIGQKKLPGRWKERVRYGDNTPLELTSKIPRSCHRSPLAFTGTHEVSGRETRKINVIFK